MNSGAINLRATRRPDDLLLGLVDRPHPTLSELADEPITADREREPRLAPAPGDQGNGRRRVPEIDGGVAFETGLGGISRVKRARERLPGAGAEGGTFARVIERSEASRADSGPWPVVPSPEEVLRPRFYGNRPIFRGDRASYVGFRRTVARSADLLYARVRRPIETPPLRRGPGHAHRRLRLCSMRRGEPPVHPILFKMRPSPRFDGTRCRGRLRCARSLRSPRAGRPRYRPGNPRPRQPIGSAVDPLRAWLAGRRADALRPSTGRLYRFHRHRSRTPVDPFDDLDLRPGKRSRRSAPPQAQCSDRRGTGSRSRPSEARNISSLSRISRPTRSARVDAANLVRRIAEAADGLEDRLSRGRDLY